MEITKTILLMSMIIVGAVYCTTYGDGSVTAEFNVQCDDSNLVVFFNKTALDERTVANYNNRSYVIKWDSSNDKFNCENDGSNSSVATSIAGLTSNGGYASTIAMVSALTGERCGVTYHSDNTYIYYNNTITIRYGENPVGNQIIREEYDVYNIFCYRNRTVEEKLSGDSFNVESRVDGAETKNNTVDFSFAFTHMDMNGASTSKYKLGDYIKFKMVLNSAVNDTKAIIQDCWATSDGVSNKYNLISNRCTYEQETTQLATSDTETTFNTEAFRFVPSGNSIYVECRVRVCLDSDTSQECTFCSKKRKRRDITDGSTKPLESQIATIKSPIFYIIDKEPAQPSSQQQQSVLSGTNGLIVVVLLSAFVFVICAAVIKKVFFTAPQVVGEVPVVSYHNKAMA